MEKKPWQVDKKMKNSTAIKRALIISFLISLIAGLLMSIEFGFLAGAKLSAIIFPIGTLIAFFMMKHQD